VSNFLLHLLQGDVDKLPTETLVHKFWTLFEQEQKQAVSYATCLTKHQLFRLECYNDIKVYCGSRFGRRSPERLDQCRQLLTSDRNATTAGITSQIARIFSNHRSCFQFHRRRVDEHCTPILRKIISDRRLRATKVVRATMDSMAPLLLALPALRVIHLVRDPRAVAMSRSFFGESARGAYTLNSRKSSVSEVVAEASQYCHHAIADIRTRLTLQRQFPGRILSVRYEDAVADPEQVFRDVYGLIDEPLPITTLTEMKKMAVKGQTDKLSTKWQRIITYADAVTIVRLCAEYFRLLGISANDRPSQGHSE